MRIGIDLAAAALTTNPGLEDHSGIVADNGEGGWTVDAALGEPVLARVLSATLFARFRRWRDHQFVGRLLSAIRYRLDGHVEIQK